MTKLLRRLYNWMYAEPDAREIAARELADAERNLLAAQTRLDFSRAEVQYNLDRIDRLNMYMRKVAGE